MCKRLPTSGFEWVNAEEIPNLEDVSADSDIGYILEVDLEYPHHLHDSHNCYPLAPDHMTITRDMLSPYQQEKYPKFAKVKNWCQICMIKSSMSSTMKT